MNPHPWAADWLKLERAKGELGPDASPEDVKKRYLELGGALRYADEPKVEPAKAVSPKKPAKKKK